MANRKATTQKRKTVSVKKKKQKKVNRSMPIWLRNSIALLISVIFLSAFYFFYIRPYSYRWKPCYGKKGYDVCMPCCYDIHGIDISHYQGEIDWNALSLNKDGDYPIHFVFMKATEGGDYYDRKFESNFKAANHSGFIRGVYHFFSPTTDPVKQAQFYINTVKLLPGDLPPVLDVEVIGKSSAKDLQQNVKTWLDLVENHYGVKPILYTSYKFKKRYLNDSIFNEYPYWIAHYYVDSVRYDGKWHFWQHTDVGSVPGIEHRVDLNVFNGSIDDLKGLTIK